MIKKALFPIAGFGTRFFSSMKIFPKEILPLIDKPLLLYAVEEALHSGIEEFIFVIREKHPIEDYFQHFPGFISSHKVHYVNQKKPLGLGHAISCAREHIDDEFFAILLPDELILAQTPCLQQMIEVHKKTHANIVAIQPISYEDLSQYGIIAGEETTTHSLFRIKDVVEKPSQETAPSSLAITGRYLLSPRIFDFLDHQEVGVNGEVQLTDSLRSLLKEELFYGLEFEGQRFDCGSHRGYLSAVLKLGLQHQEVKTNIERILKEEGYQRIAPGME